MHTSAIQTIIPLYTPYISLRGHCKNWGSTLAISQFSHFFGIKKLFLEKLIGIKRLPYSM